MAAVRGAKGGTNLVPLPRLHGFASPAGEPLLHVKNISRINFDVAISSLPLFGEGRHEQ